MPVDLGVTLVGPLLIDFARQFPGVSFDLDLSPKNTDLVDEHVDVAIRLGSVQNDQLVARRIGSVEQRLFASPTYLALRGRPTQPADLVEHECILRRGAQRQALWRLQGDAEGDTTLLLELRGGGQDAGGRPHVRPLARLDVLVLARRKLGVV